jgi:Transmembrane secretion effector
VLIIGLLGGSIADVVDRRKLALVTSAGLMAVSAAFAVQAYAQLGRLWLLYLLAAIAFLFPALTRYRTSVTIATLTSSATA